MMLGNTPSDLFFVGAPPELVAPVQWVILIVLTMLFVFDVEKRGVLKRDLQRARKHKDPTEIMVAEALVRMNLCDVIGVPFFIAWLVLRHEHLPPAGDMQALGLAFFCVGVILILIKRLFERNLTNKLCHPPR